MAYRDMPAPARRQPAICARRHVYARTIVIAGRDRPVRRVVVKKFLVKLFAKSFERRHLFEKRRHPKTFVVFKRFPEKDAAFLKKGRHPETFIDRLS
ncbi:hypothetical protein [Novacetimonas pomaceti]|uniref:hypothetical protein n=1 Tax=Novacetimonas pomaceti TaxID=2021998 RepID=UPI0010577301|nr:hypothetical protein [Novacetimonas pomaceti]